jgi:hypothetical protein
VFAGLLVRTSGFSAARGNVLTSVGCTFVPSVPVPTVSHSEILHPEETEKPTEDLSRESWCHHRDLKEDCPNTYVIEIPLIKLIEISSKVTSSDMCSVMSLTSLDIL